MDLNSPIGEKELFGWASRITKVKVTDRQHLRSGFVILKLFEYIWPNLVKLKEQGAIEKCVSKNDYIHNWRIVEKLMKQLELPLSLLNNIQALINLQFEPIYYFLVMLYFLCSLKKENDFSVDFQFPIPGELAEFLQSDRSISCLNLDSDNLPSQINHMVPFEEEEHEEEEQEDTEEDLVPANIPVPTILLSEKQVQTEISASKIQQLIASNKEMRNMIQQSQQVIEELKNNSRKSDPVESINNSPSSINWKSEKNKVKGEVLLTKMKYEIESLNRQIEFLKEEKDIQKRNFEQRWNELRIQHENELLYERERQNVLSSEAIFRKINEKLEEQSDYRLKLQKKMEDDIAFEADQIQHVIDEDFTEELMRLRQIRVIQAERIKNLEQENRKSTDLTLDLKTEMQSLQKKIQLLQKKILEQNEVRSDSGEFQEREIQYKTEIENLKYKLFKHEQKPISEDFEMSQKIERYESEIQRLKRTNDFLRQKKIISEEHKDVSDPENLSQLLDQDERLFGEVYQLMKLRDFASLEDKFWMLTRHYEAVRFRLTDVAAQNQILRSKYNDTSQTLKQREAELESRLTVQKLETESMRTTMSTQHMKQVAELSIRLQLLQEKILDMEDEALQKDSSHKSVQQLLMEEDKRRFNVLHNKLNTLKKQMRGYKVRESLWTSLIENQRRRIDSLQSKLQYVVKQYEEDEQIVISDKQEEQESEMEAGRLINELEVLTGKSAMETESDSKGSVEQHELMLVEQRCQGIQQQLLEAKTHNERIAQHCTKLKAENDQIRQMHSALKLQCDSLNISVQHLERQVGELKVLQGNLRREKITIEEHWRVKCDNLEAQVHRLERDLKEHTMNAELNNT